MIPDQFIAIDEDGFPLLNELRVNDPVLGAQILSTLQVAENGAFVAQVGTMQAVVEAFDEPFVVQMVRAPVEGKGPWTAQLAFEASFQFSLDTLSLDEWDRFHGFSSTKIPFVLSRKAQAAFFDSLEEFDDESISYAGQKIVVPAWISSDPQIGKADFWTEIYQTEIPGWELNRPAPALEEMLPRMKVPKSRVLVLGCGSGNDAAFFAEHGHVVTAVDFSHEALQRAKEKYGHLSNIRWVQKDVFDLDPSWNESFDLIFEHTCFCAIAPERRNELIKIWRRLLTPTGQLMAVFFAVEKRAGPPFGSTEWELRERLKKHFSFHFWGRWRQSLGRRNGKELFVFATKKDHL